MTATTAELRTMSLADLATVQRKIAAELSRRLAPQDRRQDAKTQDHATAAARSLYQGRQVTKCLDLDSEPITFW